TPVSVVIAAPVTRADRLLAVLRQGGFQPRHVLATTPALLAQAVAQDYWDVLVASAALPGLSLSGVLATARPRRLPVVWIAPDDDWAGARNALVAGAAEVVWPSHLEQLPLAVERLLLGRRAAEANLHQSVFQGNRAVQLLIDPDSG